MGSEDDRGFLGLTHNPFVKHGEGFFEPGERKTHLEQLRHLSQWSKRVLLVTGPEGVGKTAMYRQLTATLEPRCKAARIHGSLINASREVLDSVAQGYGIATPPDANTQLLTELIQAHVNERELSDQVSVILVDDADLLEPRSIVEILTLASRCPLQIVLFGEARLVPAIEREVGRLGLDWHEIRLGGLNQLNTREYLEWRFRQAKYRGRLPFTDQQVKEIYRLSEGLPGKINQMANVLLVKLETGDLNRSKSAFPALHRAIALLLVVVVGFLYLLWERSEGPSAPSDVARFEQTPGGSATVPANAAESASQTSETLPTGPVDSATAGATQASAATPGEAAGVEQSAQARELRTAEQAPASTRPEVSVATAAVAVGSEPPPPQSGAAADAQSGPLASSGEPSATSGEPSATSGEPSATSGEPSATSGEPSATSGEPSATSGEPSATSGEPSATSEEPSASQREPLASPSEPLTPQSDVAAGSEISPSSPPAEAVPAQRSTALPVSGRGGRWLLAQDPGKYTLQLLTLSSTERAEQFVRAQVDPSRFATYRLQRDGKILHVVVYGLFDSRAEAEAASRALPAAVGDVSPWVRSLAQVQSAARTALQ